MFVSGRVVGSERTSLPVASRVLTSLIVITPVSYIGYLPVEKTQLAK